MNYTEATRGNSYQSLPKLDRSELSLLWYSDFWDGPKSGLLLLQGGKYWFQMFEESQDPDLADFYRRFLVVELTEEQLSEEEQWHALFQEKVGRHTDYGLNRREELAKLRPRHIQEEFYSLYRERKPLDINSNPVVGWFEN